MWKREHHEALTGVDDLVNYAFLIHEQPGIMLLKDGAFLRAWYFQGPDLDYAVPEELERLSHVTSQAFQRCDNGWMLHVHSFRREQRGYLEWTVFPDPTSALIDEERRRMYERDGHFRSIAVLALTYKWPPELEGQVAKYFYEGARRKDPSLTDLLEQFLRSTTEIEDLLDALLTLQPMDAAALLTYLHMCVSGIEQPMALPGAGVDIDTLIADQDLTLGFTPKIGQQHVRVITVDGFPSMTQPGAQDFLHELALPYVWSTRCTFLDGATAGKLLNTKRKHWRQKVARVGSKAGEAMYGEASENISLHALDMARDAMEAMAEAESGEVVYGLYTMTVLVMDEDEGNVEECEVQRIQNCMRAPRRSQRTRSAHGNLAGTRL
jgi:type IV secretion system protein VirB4